MSAIHEDVQEVGGRQICMGMLYDLSFRRFQIQLLSLEQAPLEPSISMLSAAQLPHPPPHSQVLFTREQINAKVAEMGAKVALDYADKRPVFCPILKVQSEGRMRAGHDDHTA